MASVPDRVLPTGKGNPGNMVEQAQAAWVGVIRVWPDRTTRG
ncbi:MULTISPECIES: hypothetical protein [unclassified Streptomyces]